MNNLVVKTRNNFFVYFTLITILLFAVAGCTSESSDTFEFSDVETSSKDPLLIGQVPSRSIVRILRDRKPFIDSLSNQIDRPVQFRFKQTYNGIIEQMIEGKYDLAFLGPLSYIQAKQQGANYKPLVRPVRFGKSTYKSVIISRKDNGIESVDDLEQRSFAYVDPNSTSGYLFPKALMIRKYGISNEGFSQSDFLGSHDDVVRAVLTGKYSAGAVYQGAQSNLLEPNQAEKIKVLERTKPIPNEPIAIHQELDDQLRKNLRGYFRSLSKETQSHRDVLQALGDNIESYEIATDTDYDLVRTVDRTLNAQGDSP